ncbi:hypothetical protein ABG067_003199 [Albugo candida]
MDGEKVNQANLLKLAQLGIGSYLNNFGVFNRNGFQENLNGSEIRQIIDNMMDVSLKEDPNNPILYGLDSVHGANFVGKATIFPAQINIGSTFDVKYAFQVGVVASNDTAGAGSKYVFGPVADVALSKRSCRIQETFGQDSYLVSRMTAESVKGIQNNGLTRSHVPEIKNLKSFEKISLAIGETKTVTFELQQDAWTYLSPKIEENFRVVCEPGAFFVAIKYDTLCKFDGEETNEMCGRFTVV